MVTGDMFSCNVEEDASHNQQCRLRQDDTDDFDWTCNRGVVSSSANRFINPYNTPVTGPSSAKSGRNYLIAGPAKKRQIARQECVHSNCMNINKYI